MWRATCTHATRASMPDGTSTAAVTETNDMVLIRAREATS
jgi:hypothetical protein